MPVEIRTATVLDAEVVCAAVRRSITECCKADHRDEPEKIAAWLKNKTIEIAALWIQEPGGIALVATLDQKVVGFALSRKSELVLCYVIPEVLHTGVGKSLLKGVESQAAKQGFTSLRLDSTQTAKDFYLRNGYAPTGPSAYWAGLEAQPMSKQIGQTQALN